MNKLSLVITLMLAGLATGCNTVSGAGKDVEAVGETVEQVAEDTRDELKD
ncbi:MAG: entericidin A/B family lipoprotein [Gammaproteobacteria bacterium]|nr:entericidin A/B family lipoprotein [Gammaproteobacteria bacterium]